MNRRRRQPASGFATLMAVLLIAVVGTTVAAISQQFLLDARRTQDARREAQLAQMLHAGGVEAMSLLRLADDKLDDAIKQPRELALPEAVATREGKVTLTAKRGEDECLMHVDASLDARSKRETLRFLRKEGAWKLADVRRP